MWNLFKKEKEEVKAQELQSEVKTEPEKIFTTAGSIPPSR